MSIIYPFQSSVGAIGIQRGLLIYLEWHRVIILLENNREMTFGIDGHYNYYAFCF